ncbi:MAG: hypothetical protein ACRC3Y_13980 [Romboutsia sp.]|uniref:hypothetical protein n=1 Tax=Romboutsia sp. TaxID=1965302 RepID=UPI003F3FA9D4
MKLNDKKIINEYENYLLKLKLDTSRINRNIQIINDLNSYKNDSKLKLEKLERLSIDHKLYDKNYEEFRIAMGKFAVGLNKLDNKLDNLQINYKEIKNIVDIFLNFNDRFEELEQRNIMKDAYVCK